MPALNTCPDCGADLDAVSAPHLCAPSAPSLGDAPPENTVIFLVTSGDVLDDRWQIRERIGHGAMGTVFIGDDRSRKRQVAIKLLSPDHCRKPKALARFEREARALTSLRHPNIVKLFGVGRRGALPYIVMELLEGTTLADYLKQKGGKLSPVETLAVIRQVCAGLSFIHHHGLIHRDVKPQNIFIGPDGHATILDLGVAQDKSDPGLTKPGAMVGTPYYMSPEQILGTVELDRRADVYSLGAVTFELLTGRPPFLAPSNFEVLHAHRTQPPPDASLLSGFVPKAVAEVLTRSLAKLPQDRQQNAHELLAELEAAYCLENDQTNPGTPNPFYEGSSAEPPDEAPAARVEASVQLEDELLESLASTPPPAVPSDDATSIIRSPLAPWADEARGARENPTPPTAPPSAGPAATPPIPPPSVESIYEQKTRPPSGPSHDDGPGGALDDEATRPPLLPPGAPAEARRPRSGPRPVARPPVAGPDETDLRERRLEELRTPDAPAGELGELRVVATVDGLTSPAQLFIDDQPAGATPAFLRLAVGTHLVRLEKKGFITVERPATVTAQQVCLLRLPLERNR